MMMNLFSVFDPVVKGIHVNWLILMIVFLFLIKGVYRVGGSLEQMVKMNFVYIMNMFKGVSGKNYMGLLGLSVGIFMFLMMLNLLGLVSFVFTVTGQLSVTLGVGVLVWMMSFFMGWKNKFIESLSHLVPAGSPMVLAPFLVLIESVSYLIRPITLSVRLVANMVAGHLIVGLLASMSSSMSGMMISVMMQSVLLILEMGVAVIQGIVFGILLMLYSLDYY